MHKNNVKLYTVYEFFKFKIYYYQETVYKHSTRTKDILHDLKERVPIFSIYKQNIGKTTQISTKKKKKVNFRGNFIRKSDRSYNKQCSKQREEENLF